MSDETGMSFLSPGTPVLVRVPDTDIEIPATIDGPLFLLDERPFYPVATDTHRFDVPLARLSVNVDPQAIYVVNSTADGGPPVLLTGEKFMLLSVNSVGIRYRVTATAVQS